MLVKPDERVPIARLMKFMELGERLAHDCAKAQAFMAQETGLRKFLFGQARQEQYHAVAFQGAIAWLAPRHLGTCPFFEPLEKYRVRINGAVRREAFLETILAEQIILEGLGEAILKKMEEGLVKRNAPFKRMRRILLHQEEAHHGFGQRVLERAIARGETSSQELQQRAIEYLEIAESMMTSVQDIFEEIDEDPQEYIAAIQDFLPDWLCRRNQPLQP